MSARWPRYNFDEVLVDQTGGSIKTLQGDFLPSGTYPIVDQGKELVAGYTDDPNRLCKVDLSVLIFGDHTRIFKFVDFPFCIGADGIKVLRPRIEVDVKYLFRYLRQIQIPDAGYSRHFKFLRRLTIPIPGKHEQRNAVATLDALDALREKRSAAIAKLRELPQSVFMQMFGDPIANPNNWPSASLADTADRRTGALHRSRSDQNAQRQSVADLR